MYARTLPRATPANATLPAFMPFMRPLHTLHVRQRPVWIRCCVIQSKPLSFDIAMTDFIVCCVAGELTVLQNVLRLTFKADC